MVAIDFRPNPIALAYVYRALVPSGDSTGNTDTNAIQNALTGAIPNGGAIFLAPGTYYINNPLIVGPLGAPTHAQPAPSLFTMSSAGHIGDVSFPTETASVELVATSTFPLGKFMLDYQQLANGGGGSGAIVSGFTLSCQSLGSGIRFQGIRRFNVKDISISQPANPVGYADGSFGALSINFNVNSTAGAWNYFVNISIEGGNPGAGIHHNAPNQDTFVGCNVQGGPNTSNYKLDTSCQATFYGCSSQNGRIGWNVQGATAYIYGSTTEGGACTQAAVVLQGQGGLSVSNPNPLVTFVGCDFINTPGVAPGEEAGSVIQAQFFGGRPQRARFIGCNINANTNTTDWVYVEASNTGNIEFEFCTFFGTPTTNKWNDASGNNILRFTKCQGINPVGVVVVAVPVTTGSVSAAPYDRTFYVTNGTNALTIAIQNGPNIVIPANTFGTYRLPAGLTATYTYAGGVPTQVVEGE